MADDKIVIEVELETGEVLKGFGKIKDAAEDAANDSNKSFLGFSKGGLALAAAGLAAAAGAAKLFSEGISAAIEQEDAINKLNNSLAQTGQYSEKASQDIQNLASQMQLTTRFSDDAILSNAALLQSLAKLSSDGLQKATVSAADLAAGMGVDLETATRALGQAANGNTGALSRMGIKFQEGATNAESFQNALARVNQQFAGSAEKDAATFSGSLAKLKNSFGEILETIGNMVIKSPVVVAIFNFIAQTISAAGEKLKAFTDNKDLLGDLIKGLISVGKVINDFVVMPLEILYNTGKTVFYGLLTLIQGVVVAVADMATGLVGAFSGLTGIGDGLTEKLAMFRDSAKTVMVGFAEETKESFVNTFDTSFSESSGKFLETLQTTADTAAPIQAQIANNFQKIPDAAKKVQAEVDKAIGQGVVRVISTAMQAVGASLIKGGQAFNGFLKVVLGIIGDMAIQIGTTLIGIGIGIEAIRTSLATLSGGFAIAAGLALIAVGGLLKSLSGGGAGAGADASAGGGGGTGGDTGAIAASTAVDDDKAAREKQAVVVNIQGSVFDTDETGLRIATIVNESIDKQGAQFA
jgi:hypothetical protein